MMFIILTSRGSSSLAHMVFMPLLQTQAIGPLTLQFRQTEFLNMRSKYISPKGLDSTNNIDSRINMTTFFNFPDMFRYIRHLYTKYIYICVSVKNNSYYTFCRYAQHYKNEKDC